MYFFNSSFTDIDFDIFFLVESAVLGQNGQRAADAVRVDLDFQRFSGAVLAVQKHRTFMSLAPETVRKGASALDGPFLVCVCRDEAERHEPADGHEVVRRLEPYLAVVGAYVSKVGGMLLEAPVVEQDDGLSRGECGLDDVGVGARVGDDGRCGCCEPLETIVIACDAYGAVVAVLDVLENSGKDVASRRSVYPKPYDHVSFHGLRF